MRLVFDPVAPQWWVMRPFGQEQVDVADYYRWLRAAAGSEWRSYVGWWR